MISKFLMFTTISVLFASSSTFAQDDFANVEITSQPVSGSVHILNGMGGNIGVSAGEEGILIIDDQFAPLAEKIANAIGDIAKTPMKYVVNTHYHGDHTGSNAYFREIKGSTIFAHDNVRKRLANKKDHTHSELPVVTYQQGITFHFNGDTIKVMHLPAGHTDSDSVIWFEKANVLHSGDLFFEGRFPYIDLNGGGTVSGYIKNVTQLIGMLKDDTKIIPGHGNLASKADYQKALDMIVATAAMVKGMKDKGVSVEDAVKLGLGEKYKDWSWSFITEQKWITTLYNGQ
ncbi:MBL fold metallo-hydrolase [Paraglaciecola arctica]|uniref:MBL fold metallo-hydrolase n=1 Tax=Paraglaciecola arctica TaxID=1128911 RepID=UPI001C07B476|nr:MBL fold metallo-hydrolase [Paraglaciecola arctica]MBU3004900.1 MBL fold metallo-hydrolase [Paraglaciecola arctica]